MPPFGWTSNLWAKSCASSEPIQPMTKVTHFLLAVLFSGGGATLTYHAFSRLDTIRTIESLPQIPIFSVIEGEANVSGTVLQAVGTPLVAPHSKAPTVYYRYRVEKEKRDSEGKKSWQTVELKNAGTPFILQDSSGRIEVNPHSSAEISLERKYRVQRGQFRYTEHRLDVGDTATVIGFAQPIGDRLVLGFTAKGKYVPLISSSGEAKERSIYGLTSLIMTAAGLCLLSLAVYHLVRVFRIQYTLTYLSILATIIALIIGYQGILMTRDNLSAAYNRLDRELETRRQSILEQMKNRGLVWDGSWDTLLPTIQKAEMKPNDPLVDFVIYSRINLSRAIERTERIRRRIPDRWIASFLHLPQPPKINLLPSEEVLEVEFESAFTPTRSPRLISTIFIVLGLILAFFLSRRGLRSIRIKRWIENIPTSKTKGVVYGISEVKGTVQMPPGIEPLKSPLTSTNCSGYQYIVQERRGSGKNSRIVTLVNETEFVPFFCQDEEGSLLIDANESETIISKTTSRYEGKKRLTEHRLEIDSPVYAIGPVIVNPRTHNTLMMAADPSFNSHTPFIISDFPEEEVINRKASGGFLTLNIGLNCFMLASLGLIGLAGAFGTTSYLSAGLAPVVYFLLLFAIIIYNDLIFLRERCRSMWSNIDVALKKRFDLLPSLVEIVKGYLGHEKSLQEDLTRIRRSAEETDLAVSTNSQKLAVEGSILSRIFALREAYPDLKGSTTATDLFSKIKDLEDEIALMRAGYNHAVEIYNTRIQSFPEFILAKAFKFAPMPFFHSEDRELPRVEISQKSR